MSRTLKLFCIIGPLFILIAIISFLWPSFIVRLDLKNVEKIFTAETTQEQITAGKNRAALFQVKIDQTLSLIHSSILYIQESKALQQSLVNALDTGTAWKKVGEALSYNAGIGLLQVTKGSEPLLAVAPQNALLYATKITKLNDHVILSLVDDYSGVLEGYLGIRLAETPAALQDPVGFYFIYPLSYFFPDASIEPSDLLKTLKPFADNLSDSIEKNTITSLKTLIPYLAKLYQKEKIKLHSSLSKPSPKDLLAFYDHENVFFINLRIRQSIRSLLEGIDKSPFENGAPYGISSFTINPNKNFNGLSMLTSDLFFERSLTTTTSKEGSYLLIDNPLLKEVFMAATTDIATSSGSYSVTIGSSLSPLLSQLITNLEAIAIISENNKPYVAINPAGLSLPHAAIEKLSLEATAKEPYGIVEFNNVRYQFMKIEPFVDSHLAIIILRPESIDPLTSLHTTILKELNKTSDTLAWQLLGINLFILIAALIILVFLSRAVTKPVRQLAFATEALAKGNYAEIDFPSITADSKDEVSILNEGFKNMVIALRDKEKMRAVLDKVVSKEIAAEILKGHIHLGGENRIMTVMFADIRNFTHMSEKIEPERLILFLNKFMTKMSFIIEEHYGVIDKYVGDEIMALYGAPHLDADSARKAVETALLMVSELKKWNIERVAEGFPEINIGIGINTGKMVVGNMGAENRLNYTVLGSNVNLGARLCSKAEPMQILVSETTLETCGLKDSLEFQEIEALLLKGFSEPVKAFSILGFKK